MQFSAWPQQLLEEYIPFLRGKSQGKNWWWGGNRLGPLGLTKSNQLNKAYPARGSNPDFELVPSPILCFFHMLQCQSILFFAFS